MSYALKQEKYWKGIVQKDTATLEIDTRCDFKAISWIKSIVDVKVVAKVCKYSSKTLIPQLNRSFDCLGHPTSRRC